MSCVRWPMRWTMSPPKVLTVRSNSEMWRVIRAPSVPESRANFSTSSLPWFFTSSSNALICSDRLSWAVSVWLMTLATSVLTVTSSASLALSPEVMMWREAWGQPFGGVEHGGGGLGRGFLEAVEQVAAAFAERQDHVVAGMAEGCGDVG